MCVDVVWFSSILGGIMGGFGWPELIICLGALAVFIVIALVVIIVLLARKKRD